MATKAQIDANRKNAKNSTGPTTAEGKARSSMNHLSHGFTSSTFFLPNEKREEFDALLAALIDEFQPATTHQQILVERMAQNQWSSLRAMFLQSVALAASTPRGYIHKDLGVLLRYQATADRTYHRAHAELLKAQKEKQKSEIGFESQDAAEPAQTPPAAPETTESQPPAAHPTMAFEKSRAGEAELNRIMTAPFEELCDVA